MVLHSVKTGSAVLFLAATLSTTGGNDAKAFCPAGVDIGLGNCVANGSPDLSFLNIAVGFLNGSGNANGNGAEFNAQIFNTWLGLANGSGNGNRIAGPGPAVNVAALNFAAGVANGSGNGNLLAGVLQSILGECSAQLGSLTLALSSSTSILCSNSSADEDACLAL